MAVGTRFSDRVTVQRRICSAQHCPIIQIDIDSAEFDKNVDVDLRLKGDASEILDALNRRLPQHTHADWMADIAAWKADYPLSQTASDTRTA